MSICDKYILFIGIRGQRRYKIHVVWSHSKSERSLGLYAKHKPKGRMELVRPLRRQTEYNNLDPELIRDAEQVVESRRRL
jgi:hypothetical protein